jgi:hypothetical protein
MYSVNKVRLCFKLAPKRPERERYILFLAAKPPKKEYTLSFSGRENALSKRE